MAEVQVRIGDRNVLLACDDGQEDRVHTLAAGFSERIKTVQGRHPGVSENQAVILAALSLLDEFDEAKAHWANVTPEGAAAEWAASRLDEASDRLEKALAGGA